MVMMQLLLGRWNGARRAWAGLNIDVGISFFGTPLMLESIRSIYSIPYERADLGPDFAVARRRSLVAGDHLHLLNKNGCSPYTSRASSYINNSKLRLAD
jgi:hypothetical protein